MIQDDSYSSLARVRAAINLEKSDRVPVVLWLEHRFALRYKGIPQAEHYLNPGLLMPAFNEIYEEIGGWDLWRLTKDMINTNTSYDHNVLLPSIPNLIPGQDAAQDSFSQCAEAEVFTEEDYDKIAEMGWRNFLHDWHPHHSQYAPANRLPGYNITTNDPDEYWAQMDDIVKNQKEARQQTAKTWDESGVPVSLMCIIHNPPMLLSLSRSMINFTKDLYRIPNRIEAALAAMVDDMIEDSIASVKALEEYASGLKYIMIGLERCGGFIYPLRIFERFSWPYVKKMILAFIDEGIVPVLHFDQDWILNLPYLKEIPRAKCIAQLDSCTDIFKAKEILKDHMCICGDLSPSLLSLGTPEEVEAYCKKLIDVIGEGGGFILANACTVPEGSKFENLKAAVDTAKNYRPSGSTLGG